MAKLVELIIVVSKELDDDIYQVAKKNGISKDAFVRIAIIKELKRNVLKK